MVYSIIFFSSVCARTSDKAIRSPETGGTGSYECLDMLGTELGSSVLN